MNKFIKELRELTRVIDVARKSGNYPFCFHFRTKGEKWIYEYSREKFVYLGKRLTEEELENA